jgi:hypothetical protein
MEEWVFCVCFFFICEINQNKRLSIKIGAKFKILIKNISIARNKNVLAQKKKTLLVKLKNCFYTALIIRLVENSHSI